VNIRVDIIATQENKEPKIIILKNLEAPEKTKPQEKISIGLMLSDDKNINYSRTIEIKAPDFPGKVEIKVQDANHRIEELTDKVYNDPAKIEELLKFIKKSANKDNVIYLEIRYIKSITERQEKNNSGWEVTDKRTEEAINKEIREIKLPKIEGKFILAIYSDKKEIIIKKENDKK